MNLPNKEDYKFLIGKKVREKGWRNIMTVVGIDEYEEGVFVPVGVGRDGYRIWLLDELEIVEEPPLTVWNIDGDTFITPADVDKNKTIALYKVYKDLPTDYLPKQIEKAGKTKCKTFKKLL